MFQLEDLGLLPISEIIQDLTSVQGRMKTRPLELMAERFWVGAGLLYLIRDWFRKSHDDHLKMSNDR